MSSDAETRLDSPSPETRQKSMQVSRWFERHELLPALTPMAYRTGDPIEQVQVIRDGIEALPRTAATFTARDFLGDTRTVQTYAASGHLLDLFRLCRAFRCDDTSTGYRWSNPEYCHGSVHREPWGSRAQRVAFARQVAPLGVVETADIARHFGVGPSTIRHDFQKANFDWARRRRAGRRRLARTVETIVDWTEHTYREVCAALGMSPAAHRHHRNAKLDDEWTPPADPTTEVGPTRQ